ncbi:preprotein translocase subunit SecG [Candidatus Gottesmanbacteria bacterium RBG_13_45_10]|uniref:Protein-export membrane protein SecG n=1 Tax=Candidatus Gottesmanbacteria bacterium RBG_13_45_10 TaxID=1798370 RepID=A0A1F5ZI20_9BACT|nr:MAG: preprotein translocase subunit SecG [Candidatus Gottesmanbacteria bacterium RBG_13_45_10]
MKIALLAIHVIVAVSLISLILLQNSKGGLSAGLGGGGEFYRSKRGAERVVFTATIIVSVLFLITSILNLFVR